MNSIEYYTGNEKFAYCVFCRRDAERVDGIIGAAIAHGIRLWADESFSMLNEQSSEKLRKSGVCVLFVSRSSVCSHAFRSTLTAAIEMGTPIVSVYLEKTELTICQRLQIARTEMINVAEISTPKKYQIC